LLRVRKNRAYCNVVRYCNVPAKKSYAAKKKNIPCLSRNMLLSSMDVKALIAFIIRILLAAYLVNTW
jgi:hypothetical protein